MGSDDHDEPFTTTLSLDLLGFTPANKSFSSRKLDPSLSLGLADLHAELSISPVGSSSQSNNKSQIHKDGGYGDEVEVDRLCSQASDDDPEEEFSPRKKLRLSKQQSAILEDSFNQHCTLSPNQKEALAKQLNLRPRQVEVWFQNRRARTKLKQTEMECEMMRKCWETLTEENRRLKKEVTELKSLKVGTAVYMAPPPTLSICPSCGGDGGGRLFSPT